MTLDGDTIAGGLLEEGLAVVTRVDDDLEPLGRPTGFKLR